MNELYKIAAIEPLELKMRLRWTGHVYRLRDKTPAIAILKDEPKSVRPKAVPLTEFRIHLNLFAIERAISSKKLKLWQLTEHADKDSL